MSWAVYVASGLVLVGLFASPLSAVAAYSQRRALADAVGGTVSVIDSLSPGLSVDWSYAGTGGVTLAFAGKSVVGRAGGLSVVQDCTWPLQPANPSAGSRYVLRISGGVVTVSALV